MYRGGITDLGHSPKKWTRSLDQHCYKSLAEASLKSNSLFCVCSICIMKKGLAEQRANNITTQFKCFANSDFMAHRISSQLCSQRIYQQGSFESIFLIDGFCKSVHWCCQSCVLNGAVVYHSEVTPHPWTSCQLRESLPQQLDLQTQLQFNKQLTFTILLSAIFAVGIFIRRLLDDCLTY